MQQLKLKLSAFEGPLDLLVHLIEKSELDIHQIFVSEITSQYLAYMEEIDMVDMEMASEFLAMAATLIYIKSRAVLPKPQPIPDENEIDPEEKLIAQIRAYQQFKLLSKELEAMAQHAQEKYTRLPEEYILPPQPIEIDAITLDQLIAAFSQALQKKQQNVNVIENIAVRRDAYTVELCVKNIQNALKNQKRISFRTFLEKAEKLEIIVSFMAILELLAMGEIHLTQENAFEEIIITSKTMENIS